MHGKYAPSKKPTRKRRPYSWFTLVTAAQEKLAMDQRISAEGTISEGRIRVMRMTAGICPMTYPAVKTLDM